MDTNKLFPFMNRTTISDETKIDGIKESGTYTLYQLSSTSYCPVQYGMLIVFRASSIAAQIAISNKNNTLFLRVDWNNEGWSVCSQL